MKTTTGRVVALTSFATDDGSPFGRCVRRGETLRADDPVVKRNPQFFANEDTTDQERATLQIERGLR